ncbi:MAG: hypothetical protein JJLCMIEE_00946 [Acidimicrobiales bacterium]|nr:MAG: hypothetical protein EDR02_11225 [Actinomycetota bacterium]MBV6507888.1 hypothetical protein [Acidimicrobiales bacterium]RIK06032.1 MAG: hypothetical protein DCC48_08765 [Acidobacteriota bacterium]
MIGVETMRPAMSGRWMLTASLLVLNYLDVMVTRLVLDAGGREVNPLMEPVMDGTLGPVLVKTAVVAVIALLLLACPPRSRLVDHGLAVVVGVYAVVVSWNALVLAQVPGV